MIKNRCVLKPSVSAFQPERRFAWLAASLAVFLGVALAGSARAADSRPSFGLPIACPVDMVCPLQQMTDLDPGPEVADPFCGVASYDGHKGSDFRVLSMKDTDRGVPVVAMAAGRVKAMRDGMADRLVMDDADRAAIADRECGNGVIIDHGGGWESQYCHMRLGSIRVRNGDTVEKGSVIGLVGASGLAAFPHVHAGVRHNDAIVDPMTGATPQDGCSETVSPDRSLFDPEAQARLPKPGLPQVLAAGFAPGAIDDGELVVNGPPALPTARAYALTGYIWAINLKGGDRIRLTVTYNGTPFAADVTEPMNRAKAVYVAFAGRKGNPKPGRYELTAEILRNGDALVVSRASADIR